MKSFFVEKSSCNTLISSKYFALISFNIADQSIMTRAQASLPSGYLALRTLDSHRGIFAKKTIPKTCRFGPVEGKHIKVSSDSPHDHQDLLLDDDAELTLTILENDGSVTKLDLSDEEESNWMRFVRPADRYAEQNLILSQEDDQLFFTSTRNIQPRQELRVGYSPAYCEARGLRPPLQPGPDDQHLGKLVLVSIIMVIKYNCILVNAFKNFVTL